MLPHHRLRLAMLKAVHKLTAKSVQSFADDYRIQLSELVADNLNGDIDATTQAAKHRALLQASAEDIYAEGMFDSGKFDSREEASDSVDAEDREHIGEWVNEQVQFVSQFAKDTSAARLDPALDDSQNEARQNAILERVNLWGRAMQSLGDEGRASGSKNVMVTWQLGETEVHCQSGAGKVGCAELSGKRHKIKWFTSRGYIPRKPGNDKITCGGWRCECRLVSDSGAVIL